MDVKSPSKKCFSMKFKECSIEVIHVNPKFNATIWDQIVNEIEEDNKKLAEYKRNKYPAHETQLVPTTEYMQAKLLGVLRKGLEEMLFKAISTNSLSGHKSIFNGIDFLAEYLWNQNPMHPKRAVRNINLFDFHWVKSFLQKHHRPFFPLSWIYTEQVAARIIQRSFRAYLVRRRDDVQEMRQFWMILKEERQEGYPDHRRAKSVQIDISGDYRDASAENVRHMF